MNIGTRCQALLTFCFPNFLAAVKFRFLPLNKGNATSETGNSGHRREIAQSSKKELSRACLVIFNPHPTNLFCIQIMPTKVKTDPITKLMLIKP